MEGRYNIRQDARQLAKVLLPTHRVSAERLESILDHRAFLSRVAQHWISHAHIPSDPDDDARHHFQSVVGKLAEARPAFVDAYQNLLASGFDDATVSDVMIGIIDQEVGLPGDLAADALANGAQFCKLRKELASVVKVVKRHPRTQEVRYRVDPVMSTNQHTFTVFGPHSGTKYGDIAVVFKTEIMYHPDFNMSPNAATAFHSGSTLHFRPWAFEPSATQEDRIWQFHRSKLHPSTLEWDLAVGGEFQRMAATCFEYGSNGQSNMPPDVAAQFVSQGQNWNWISDRSGTAPCVEGIFSYIKSVDCHFVWHCHLPEVVPLDYIAKIFIPSCHRLRLSKRLSRLPPGVIEFVNGDVY